MKQEFEIFEGYNLNVTNYCHCRGHYYSEDDWSIDVFGDSLDEVVRKFWIDEFPLIDLDINEISFSKKTYIIYNNRRVILESESINNSRDILKLFYIDEYSTIGRQKKDAIIAEKKLQDERFSNHQPLLQSL